MSNGKKSKVTIFNIEFSIVTCKNTPSTITLIVKRVAVTAVGSCDLYTFGVFYFASGF